MNRVDMLLYSLLFQEPTISRSNDRFVYHSYYKCNEGKKTTLNHNNMKRIISLAMAALMVCSIANAQATKETIKEFPPEQTLDMIAKVWELAGIMVDEKR